MSEHVATVHWQRDPEADFAAGRYSRLHEWRFDGGAVVPASASPHAVRAPWSAPAAVDPEEAFVAALASCHMLWFLALAAQRGFVVDAYVDAARAELEEIAPQRQAITRVVLRPRVVFAGFGPDTGALADLHRAAHEHCFIANSVKTAVSIEADEGASPATSA
jgi:organic hydroperoxide reductase OsmC/OhrA